MALKIQVGGSFIRADMVNPEATQHDEVEGTLHLLLGGSVNDLDASAKQQSRRKSSWSGALTVCSEQASIAKGNSEPQNQTKIFVTNSPDTINRTPQPKHIWQQGLAVGRAELMRLLLSNGLVTEYKQFGLVVELLSNRIRMIDSSSEIVMSDEPGHLKDDIALAQGVLAELKAGFYAASTVVQGAAAVPRPKNPFPQRNS